MSTTETKRPLAQARTDAECFRDLFRGCYERWEIAGSIRRKRPWIGDAEHVVMAKLGEATPLGGMFPQTVNLVWNKLEEMEATGALGYHVYHDCNGRDTLRRGELYRGVDYCGMNHEIFLADERNWGCILTIRTGPADFGHALVERLRAGGRIRQKEGYVRHVVGTAREQVIKVPTERDYFTLCGVEWLEPEDRF